MYNFDLLEMDNDLNIVVKEDKFIYNTDTLPSCAKWVRKPILKEKTFDAPQMTSAVNYKNSGRGNIAKDSLGYMDNSGNNVRYNGTRVGLYTSCFSNGNGVSILEKNFYQVVSLFTARKVVEGNWINWYDEYLTPNEKHESFEQFKYDSIVYSLFESKSNQSSLRQITYNDRLWDIKNEFFWMPVDKMKELADRNGYDELYNDARTSPDRYVHKLLFGEERIYDKLSPDAKLVLDKATELVEKSMELRQVMANEENHLNSWDAGYAQLKLVWKEYFQEDFKEFRQLYKNLEDRMRPLVYELGFLKK
jgi:hypothetical protein